MDIPASIANVSADSLANLAGLVPGEYDDQSEDIRPKLISIQLGILQQPGNDKKQAAVHHEFAAKYLPVLAEKYREDLDLTSTIPAELINAVAYTPYFARFAATEAGNGLVNIQIKRFAELTDRSAARMDLNHVAAAAQFLSTLLALQGQEEIPADEKSAAVARMKKLKVRARGTFAAKTLDRCLSVLDGNARDDALMFTGVKLMLEAPFKRCGGGKTCKRSMDDGEGALLNCSRCRTAVYCGAEHQKAAWASHKPLCFTPAF